MSIVTLQVGQCGNQIGFEFFKLIMKDAEAWKQRGDSIAGSKSEEIYYKDVIKRFFTEDEKSGACVAKAVLVDTEPKVVNRVTRQANQLGTFKYHGDNVYLQQRGSGNNWAYGFNQNGEKAVEKVMNSCRKELEQCDRFGGFLVMMSLAGGTGSGLGTRLTADLRDSFPGKFILNQAVLPYSSGEVILQNYNTILTLSHLYNNSSGISLFENDHLSQICQKSLGLKSVTMDSLNAIAAHKLCSVLQPSLHHGQSVHSVAAWQSTIGDLLETLCAIPRYKLLCIKNSPHLSEKSMAYSTFVWPALLKHLHQMLITNSPVDEGINWELKPPPVALTSEWKFSRADTVPSGFNKSVANLLILRGSDLHQADITSFLSRQLYPPWKLQVPCNVWTQSRRFIGYQKSAAIVTNSQSHVRSLDNVVTKGWNMFSSRAYIHQYLQCGVEEDDFIDSFAGVEQILSDYSSL